MAKRNLLLVDADPRSLRVLEVSLRKAGYSVATCAAVDDALELISLSEPDLVIADTRLPGKDGFAFAKELRSRPATAQIPFLFLSSDPSVEAKVKSLEIGIEDYLTKPVYMREILTRVSIIMERSERGGLGRTSKTRFSGSLEDMGLVDLLQTIEVSRKSGVLKLSYGQRRGSVTFMEGRVIDAELGQLRGEAAIYRFLLWSEGAFELEFREVKGEDKLGISTQALLMEGVRRLDEWGRLQEQLPGLHAVLEVNHAELSMRLGEVPDELNAVLRVFDGQRDLIQVIEASGGDDLAMLTAISKLFFDGFLMVRHRTDPSEARVGASDPFIGYVPTESSPPGVDHLRDMLPSAASAGAVSSGDEPLAGAVQPSRAPSNRAQEPEEKVASAHVPSERAEQIEAEPEHAQSGARRVEEADDAAAEARASSSRVAAADTAANVTAGRVPLAVLQLKRVSAIREGAARPQAVSRELMPEARASDDGAESSRLPQSSEGEDDMGKRKRKERAEERTGGTVIPLHGSRPEAAQSGEVLHPQAAHEPSAPIEQLSGEDDHAQLQDFFAASERVSQPLAEHWGDLESGDHDHDHDHLRHRRRRGMIWTAAIATLGLVLIGAFLVYHKVVMPTPEELRSGPVSLPTPDMLRGAEQPTLSPEPVEPPAPVQPADPANAAPANPPSNAPTEQAASPNAAPAEGAPSAPVPASDLKTPGPQGIAPSAPAPSEAPVAATAAPLAAKPDDPSLDAQIAQARKLGTRRAAEPAFLKIIEAAPSSDRALSGLALYYLNLGKNKDAKARAEQAVAVAPNNSEAWIVLGAAHDALGDRRGARDAYAKCAELPADKYVAECKRMLH